MLHRIRHQETQRNGFAKRNIRSVRDMLREVLLDKKVSWCNWRQLLVPGLVFALNFSVSKATKCIPYQVVFGRQPTLPVWFLDDSRHSQCSFRRKPTIPVLFKTEADTPSVVLDGSRHSQCCFRRKPTLPVDLLFNTLIKSRIDDVITPQDYVEEIELTLNELFNLVIDRLHLSRLEMLKHSTRKLSAFTIIWTEKKYG